MRIAVIADVHGNILALEAVLADLDRRGGADRFINLGDCVAGPLWPRETMERLDVLGWPTVRGNHDRRVALDPLPEMGPSDKFAHDRLTPRAARPACRPARPARGGARGSRLPCAAGP